MRRLLGFILSTALFCASVRSAEPPGLDFAPSPLKAGMALPSVEKITARMQAFVDEGKTAGVVTLLARHGQVAMLKAVGFQDREAKTPMRVDSIFQIMSMTKPVTSVGIMILMEEGRLALVDPVEKHLPKFKGQMLVENQTKKKPGRLMTIWDLLTHTSGIPGSLPAGMSGPNEKWAHTLEEIVDAYAAQPLQSEPGVKWQYSNAGMATLGRIIEVVSGMPYEKFMARRIFEPLGMKDTHYFLPAEKRARLAAAYTDNNGVLKRADVNLYREGARYPSPEGGLHSTASDLARFYQMMLNRGTLNGRRILSPVSVEVMTTVHTGDMKAGFAPGLGYGLGWGVVRESAGEFRLNSIGAYGHGGAWRTYGWVDPKKDMLGVILQQRTNGGGDVADEINAFMAMAAVAIVK